ncbi:MAG: tetratricopeptide repeat protein, partial [Elusimicrobia bacterium]|nr:tetratricopeptide repeat protein [Elusimicrobiota bacterium]
MRTWQTASLVPLLGLLLGAGGCRGERTAPRDPFNYEDYFDYFDVDVFRPRFVEVLAADGRPRYATRYYPIGRRPQEFAAEKDPGSRRVFVLGGSVAQRYDGEGTRPRLPQIWRTAFPGETMELINCGTTGYDSSRDRILLEELLSYRPDAVVVMSGVNESKPRPRAWLAKAYMAVAGIPVAGRLCRKIVEGALALEWAVSDQRDPRRFENNIRQMARAARRRGVPLVLCTLPVNLRDMPPRGSLPLADEEFFAAWAATEAGDGPQAERLWRRYLAGHPDAAMAHFFLAKCRDRAGDSAQAREHYVAAFNLGRGAPVPELNRSLRRIAAEEGEPVADLERAFAAVSPQGLVGSGIMDDDVHWSRFADPLVSLAIAQALAEPRCRKADCAQLAGLARSIPLEVGRQSRGASQGRSWQGFWSYMWKPFAEYRDEYSERVVALIESIHRRDPGLLREALRLKSWLRSAVRENPGERPETVEKWWPPLLEHVGEFHRRRGDPAQALTFFDEALRRDPGLRMARVSRGVAYLALGQRARALAALASLEGRPEVRHWIRYYDSRPPARPPAARAPDSARGRNDESPKAGAEDGRE